MSNLEITIYGGIVVAIVTIFILTPLKNYFLRLFKWSDNNEELSTTENNKTETKLLKTSDITSMEKTHDISFEKARKIAKEKSDAKLNVWQSEARARIETSLIEEAKGLLESRAISTFEEAKKLAQELSDAELELWQTEARARIEKELLESAKRIIDQGKASTFEEAKKIAQQESDSELKVWQAEAHARIEKALLEETKKLLKGKHYE